MPPRLLGPLLGPLLGLLRDVRRSGSVLDAARRSQAPPTAGRPPGPAGRPVRSVVSADYARR
ncbi:hypothetical protein FTX61_07815 [Nitriliruptoraceae bacterium ZYF776]|nr:hypothetical protein [Profundirhabdus halotolerans]